MSRFIPADRKTDFLFPPSVEDWLPEDHLSRFVAPPYGASAVDVMAHRLKTRTGRADYALRKQTVEPVFGIIKHVMKFRQFLMRGKRKGAHEWNLVALTWNLKRMNALKMA